MSPVSQGPCCFQSASPRNVQALDTLLAEDAIFHSPVVHTPQIGKAITTKYLAAAFRIFFHPSFRYVREFRTHWLSVQHWRAFPNTIDLNTAPLLVFGSSGTITPTYQETLR